MTHLLPIVLSAPDASLLYHGHYDLALVLSSVALAIFSSYAALLVSNLVAANATGPARRIWMTVGSLCLGAGVWAMHFVGMLAFSLPCSTSYDPGITLLSMVPGIFAGAIAVEIMSQRELSSARLARGALLMGAGIGAMHYAGMAAMRLDGLIRYDLSLFLLSFVAAVALAMLAMWVKLRLQNSDGLGNGRPLLASAMVLGLAVCAMHYTAMAAAYFVRDGNASEVDSGISPAILAAIVLVSVCLLVVVTIVATYVENRKLLSLKRSYGLIAALMFLWGVVSFISTDRYHSYVASDSFEQESQLAQEELEQIAKGVDEGIQLLKGISLLISRDDDTRQALHHFGPQIRISALDYEDRKQAWTQDKTLGRLNESLGVWASHLNADQIFVLNASGDCIAASNSQKPTSFVGTNFSDRDYFLQARGGQAGHQYAMGRMSKVPGLFYSTPILEHGSFIGAAVVKRDLSHFSPLTQKANGFIADRNGVIVLAANKQLEFRTLPGALINSLPGAKADLQYGQRSFKPLLITPWRDQKSFSAVLIDGSHVPTLLASRSLTEDAITLYLPRSLAGLDRLGAERMWLFTLLAAAGGLLIVTAAALVHRWREAQSAAADMRIAATAFESQSGMLLTDAQQLILRVNSAFTEITGYSPQEAVNQTPRMLASGRHGKAFYASMRASLAKIGSWQGEVWNRRKNGEIYPAWLSISAVKNSAGMTTHYVGNFIDISLRKAAEEQIQSLAFSDLLTGLPNRRMLIVQLQQAMSSAKTDKLRGALLLIDLDNFKNLNDTLGHERGDLVLQQFARRLGSCIREQDTVARLGADEFVVLLEQLDQNPLEAALQAEMVANKILDAIRQAYLLDGSEISCTASIGITLFGEQHEDAVEPLKRAELAMYHAKEHGRDTLRFFDPQMQAVVNMRVAMEAGLREAIEKDQFLLYYQAQVQDDGEITGVEALLRWQHPRRGMVSPAEFIPMAEESGLILPIGNWVLETACRQLAQWASVPDMAQLTIAVNVSAKQFRQREFVDQVLMALDSTGANPNRLKLELTESVLVANVEDVIAKMNILRERCVGFALDDFGTGYSSLSYLKRLPLDQLKIDQGFVRDILVDPNDAAIASMVVALAGSMGLAVIAEGVETEAQRDFLAGLGCRNYQGYLFSRPLPVADFEAFCKRTPQWCP